MAYEPALSNGSPVARYRRISSSGIAEKCTCVVSTKLRRSASGRRMSVTPVITECLRPASFTSMFRASSLVRGFPSTCPSSTTSVSAAMIITGPTARAETRSALASAKRCTNSCGDSPGIGVSSTAEDNATKERPASRRISARRSEAEARINFMAVISAKDTTDALSLMFWACLKKNRFLVFAEDSPKRVRNLSNRSVSLHRPENRRQQIFLRRRPSLQFGQCRFCLAAIPLRPQRLHPLHLFALDLRIDAQGGDGALLLRDELIHANHDLLFRLHRPLVFVSRFLDFTLHEAALNRPQHASQRIDSLDVSHGATFNFIREVLDRIRARNRIDRIYHAGFMRDDLLGAQRDQRCVLRGQRQRFVQRIGV